MPQNKNRHQHSPIRAETRAAQPQPTSHILQVLEREKEREEYAWEMFKIQVGVYSGTARERKAAGKRVRKESFLAGYRAGKAS